MNHAAEVMSGYVVEEAMGKKYQSIFHIQLEKDHTPNVAFVEDAIASGNVTRLTNHSVIVSRSGQEFAITNSAAPIRNANGTISGAVVVFHDISKERSMDKIKSEFLTISSHQLRTPLTEIKWALEAALTGELGTMKPKQKEFAQHAYDAANRMSGLIESLLNLSEIEAGGIAAKPIVINLPDIVEETVSAMSPIAESKKIHIAFKKETAINLKTDPTLLRDALTNVLSNAITYSPDGEKIAVEVHMTGTDADISVADHGIGIPKDVQSQVFQKFFRADNAMKTYTEGKGIGLYSASRLVQMLHGKIWFESEEGKGTIFHISIPRT